MLSQFENKAMDHAAQPDVEALRAQAERLSREEARLEAELHIAKSDLAAAEVLIAETMRRSSKGGATGGAFTTAMLAQGGAQRKIVGLIEELEGIRPLLAQANDAVNEAEARHAGQEAVTIEAEIVSELAVFADEMLAYLRHCQKIEALRERVRRRVNQALLTPPVVEALNSSWGETHFFIVQSRLELIAKCISLSEEGTTIVRTAAQERAS